MEKLKEQLKPIVENWGFDNVIRVLKELEENNN